MSQVVVEYINKIKYPSIESTVRISGEQFRFARARQALSGVHESMRASRHLLRITLLGTISLLPFAFSLREWFARTLTDYDLSYHRDLLSLSLLVRSCGTCARHLLQ